MLSYKRIVDIDKDELDDMTFDDLSLMAEEIDVKSTKEYFEEAIEKCLAYKIKVNIDAEKGFYFDGKGFVFFYPLKANYSAYLGEGPYEVFEIEARTRFDFEDIMDLKKMSHLTNEDS